MCVFIKFCSVISVIMCNPQMFGPRSPRSPRSPSPEQDAPLVFIEQAVCAECTTKAGRKFLWAHDHGPCGGVHRLGYPIAGWFKVV